MNHLCPLCKSNSEQFFLYREKYYFKCNRCKSVFADPKSHLDYEEELARYLTHQNDTEDLGYQNFVWPIVKTICETFNQKHIGLDFGAGTGPVISKMLTEKGYNIYQYDPFFHNEPELLNKKYDYIACCEVIEHFHDPQKEFALLRQLLNPNGELICKTDILTDDTNFTKWYYKDDPTHVFFYHPNAFEYIKMKFGFLDVIIDNRLIRFLN